MTPGLLEEWWQIVSLGEFQINALATLRIMWEGAPSVLPEKEKGNVVSWERVVQFLNAYGLSLPS